MGLASSEKIFPLRVRAFATSSLVRFFRITALLTSFALFFSFSQFSFAAPLSPLTPKTHNPTVRFNQVLLSVQAEGVALGVLNVLFTDAPFSPKVAKRLERDQDEPTIKRSRYVLVQFDLLRGSGFPFVLNLFEDVSFVAVQDRVEIQAENRYTWFGSIEGTEQSQVILVVEDGSMAGNIMAFPDFYQIRAIGDGVHGVYEIDQSAFPPHAQPIVPNH